MTPVVTHSTAQHPDPQLTAVVVHWRNEAQLAALVDAWPDDPRLELLVVDNSSTLGELAPPARCLDPGGNLGFAGGVNRGTWEARGRWILILNPDLAPRPGALDALLAEIAILDADPSLGTHGGTGLVPALVDADGTAQSAWQLRPLPTAFDLLLQTLLLAGVHGPRDEPPAGTPIAQPAGAALCLRRSVLESVGGLDEGFHPAWFEDVDLARRLGEIDHRMLYLPSSRFTHDVGGSVPELGYGPFLWVYYRNLLRYLRRHHRAAVPLARLTLPLGMLLRLVLLPLRRPRRAASRAAAARGLLAVVAGALSGWRLPRAYAERFTVRN